MGVAHFHIVSATGANGVWNYGSTASLAFSLKFEYFHVIYTIKLKMVLYSESTQEMFFFNKMP